MFKFSQKELMMIAIILDEEEEERMKARRQKRMWVRKAWKKRESEGELAILYKTLTDDGTKFLEYFRMSENCFNILLNKLKIHLKKRDTNWRKAVTPKERLAVCLRYLTTGDSLKTISFRYRLGHSTVYEIVRDTCKILTEHLINEMMPIPTKEMWKIIADDFYNLWNFPNCLGALGGKHVTIQAPANSHSLFSNHKRTCSVPLLTLADAHCNFIAVDIGPIGKKNEGGIFAHSNLRKAIERGTLNTPGNASLPNTDTTSPYVFVGDEAFPLKTYLMRPYPEKDLNNTERVFNYHLSRARRAIENAFDILSQTFKIYNRRIQATPQNVDYIILATCILHNFIKKYDRNKSTYGNSEASNTFKARSLDNLPFQGGNATRDAFLVREQLKDFFNLDENKKST